MIVFTYVLPTLSHAPPIFSFSPPHTDFHSGDHTSWLLKQLFFFLVSHINSQALFLLSPPFRFPGPFLFFLSSPPRRQRNDGV